jgi:hypothetical protein
MWYRPQITPITRPLTVRVEGYGQQELQSDVDKLSRFLTSSTTLVLADRGVYVGKLRSPTAAPRAAPPAGG